MPAAPTYDSIETKTVGAGISAVDFTSISQSFTDLVLVCNFAGISGTNFSIRVGSGNTIDAGSNYIQGRLLGYQTGAAQFNLSTDSNGVSSNLTVGSLGSATITYCLNYAQTGLVRTFVTRFGDGNNMATANVYSSWNNTANAINCLRVYSTNGANFAAGSIFSLYGIAAA